MQSEERFQRLNWLAAELLDVPVSLVGLLATDTVIFRGAVGLQVDETSRPHAFFRHTLRHEGILLVPDASQDMRFYQESLVVTPPFVRFFAGIRLLSSDGTPFAGLCVMDTEPRIFRAREKRAFEGLAMIAADMHKLYLLERQSH